MNQKKKIHYLKGFAIVFVISFLMSLINWNGAMASEGEKMDKKSKPLKTSEVAKLFSEFNYDAHQLDASTFLKKSREKGVLIIDLRSSLDFKKGHALGAINLDSDVTEEKLQQLIPSKETILLAYCTNSFEPTRMVALTHTLVPQIFQLGYKKVFFLEAMAGYGAQGAELKKQMKWTSPEEKK